jgi:hypothetical protein
MIKLTSLYYMFLIRFQQRAFIAISSALKKLLVTVPSVKQVLVISELSVMV